MSVLEHLIPEDWDTARRNFERLERVFSFASQDGDGFGFKVAGIGVRFGSKAVTHTASVQGSATVTHGLGTTPAAVLATVVAGADGTAYTASVFSVGATTFGLLTTRAPAFSGTLTVYWIAVG